MNDPTPNGMETMRMTPNIFLIMALMKSLPASAPAEDATTTDGSVPSVGNQKQLFFDDSVIDRMEGIRRSFEQPVKHLDSPVLRRERPWELGLMHPAKVIHDLELDLFHMWYGAHAASAGYDGRVSLCYARSRDGVHWERPDLDLVQLSEKEGGTPNNIIGTGPVVQTAVIDPDAASPDERIVLLRGGSFWTSPDGFHLEKRGEFGDLRRADVTDPDPAAKYFFTGQTWAGKGPWGANKRGIMRAETDDLLHWQGYRVIFDIGPDDPQELEYYTMSVQSPLTADSYSGWYLGFLHVFHTDLDGKRHPVNNVAMSGPVDVALAASRDSVNWFLVAGHRPFLPVGPEGSFDSRMLYLESMVQFEDQLYFYYSGWNVEHGIWVGTVTEEGHAEIGLATLPLDRFVALQPTNGHGEVVTHPFVLEGAQLEVNADPRHGQIRIEVLDGRGDPVPGFTEDTSVAIVEDGLRTVAQWAGVPDLSRLRGSTIRLRFVMERDAKLYAFRIVEDT